ncbi:Extension Ser/Thr-type protein kinase [Rhizoctonia solani]|uniref:cAMP-dependent protein kinase n=1 Tax=Rhizoctonia solani TaxID=456999 RepID=A0A8H7ID81_9AGAM|nr:Extension Ser/Thr-type protein kinase [Rhizoctonia solani]
MGKNKENGSRTLSWTLATPSSALSSTAAAQQQAQQYYPSAPSSAATPSLFAGTTRSSISSAYSHASPGVTHYPPPPEPDVSLDQLLESAYASDAPSPPTIDSGLLAGMDVNALVGDLNIDMLGMDMDMGIAPAYDTALDEFFGKMHDLGLDPSHVARVPPAEPLPVFRHPSTSSPASCSTAAPTARPITAPATPANGAGTNSDVERTKGEAETEQLFVEGFPHFAYTRYWELWSCPSGRHNHRHYAIKVLNKAKVVQQKQVEHTNSERSVLTLVRHPFIVNLWGTFQDVNNLFMVMDFVPGGELFTLLRKSRRFPSPVAKFYTAEVVLAIDYLHSHDIIYRTSNPRTSFSARRAHQTHRLWIRQERPGYHLDTLRNPRLPRARNVNQKSYNKSVDWYAVGILLYEMLAGAPPFFSEEPNPMRLYERIRAGRSSIRAIFESGAVDLMRGLLVTDLSLRLGNMIGGSKDVFNHHWFSEVPWEKLANKEVQPPFERYNEEDAGQYGQMTGRDPHAALFTDFGPLAF